MDKNLKLFKNSKLHDYELIGLDINYLDFEINIRLKSPAGLDCDINIENFMSCEVSHKEPWGSGKYIVFSNESYDEIKKIKIIELELNSGDLVKITKQ